MKIRNGFVSNSSSSSFIIPSFLLTDEQKEMLLSIDDSKDIKEKFGVDSKNNYPINEEYHKIYKDMIKNKEWSDMEWTISESNEFQIIQGSTSMWNGSINTFMKKIGINRNIIEMTNHGHFMVHMAQHPKAIKHFITLHKKTQEKFDKLSKKEQDFEISIGLSPLSEKSPYEIDDNEFEPFGKNSLEFKTNQYCYIKKRNNNTK